MKKKEICVFGFFFSLEDNSLETFTTQYFSKTASAAGLLFSLVWPQKGEERSESGSILRTRALNSLIYFLETAFSEKKYYRNKNPKRGAKYR